LKRSPWHVCMQRKGHKPAALVCVMELSGGGWGGVTTGARRMYARGRGLLHLSYTAVYCPRGKGEGGWGGSRAPTPTHSTAVGAYEGCTRARHRDELMRWIVYRSGLDSASAQGHAPGRDTGRCEGKFCRRREEILAF
jgi:hypothetical protein